MKQISLYIARQMIPWLMLGITGISLLFLTSQLLRVAPVFAGAGLAETGRALGLAFLPVIGWALTPAFAIAVFAAFSRMEKDGELTALDASGLRRSALAIGPVALAFGLALLSAGIWLYAGPWAQRRLRDKALDMAAAAVARSLRPGQFISPLPGITFYAEEKAGASVWRRVFLEDARNPEQTAQFAARSADLKVAQPDRLLALRLESGSAFFASAPGPKPPAVLSFQQLDLKIPLDRALESRVGFLPELLARSTADLMKSAPEGTPEADWAYALWRRIAGPSGFLSLGLLSIALAISSGLRGRAAAVAIAAGLFLFYHLLSRAGESLLASRAIGAKAAALAPAVAIAAALLFVLVLPFLRIRLSGRR